MIIFDLDRTLRDINGSEHLEPQGNQRTVNTNWHDWQHYVNSRGTPIQSTVNLFLSVSPNVTVLTSSQFGTSSWLYRHGLYPADIIERHYDDNRVPFEFKKDFIDTHRDDITLWVDDDAEVLDYVESLGILTVRVTDGLPRSAL